MLESHTTEPNFWVKNIPIYGDLILAPMTGISNLPFRLLARSYGSAMSYTEFVNAMDVINGHPYLLEDRLTYSDIERPIVFQIFDNNPERILRAALLLRQRNPDIIDINMGCSAKTVSNRGAGAGLLQTPDKIAQIFSLLTRSLDIPITGKIRLGWDRCNLNYLTVAHIIEDNGGQLLAVHARTREQKYTGFADWDAIAEIKRSISIPVIANGDVRTVVDIERIKKHTQCEGVMIGRAAMDNPWIFSRRERSQVGDQEVRTTMQLLLKRTLDFYGTERGMRLYRKYIESFLAPYSLTREQRLSLLTCTEPEKLLERLDHLVFSTVLT